MLKLQAFAKALPFAVLFAAAAYLFSRTLRFDFPRAPGRLGPDVWPQAILVLLMIACAAGVVRSVLSAAAELSLGERNSAGNVSVPVDAQDEDVPPRYGLVAAGLLLFLAYPVALDYLGFLVATFLLMLLFMVVGQWRNIPGVIAVSLVGTFVLFYVFRGVVYVSLPLGQGPFHDFTVWVASVLGMR